MQAVDFRGKWSVVLGVQLDVMPHTSRSMCVGETTPSTKPNSFSILNDLVVLGCSSWAWQAANCGQRRGLVTVRTLQFAVSREKNRRLRNC